jgi:hypothetical protein
VKVKHPPRGIVSPGIIWKSAWKLQKLRNVLQVSVMGIVAVLKAPLCSLPTDRCMARGRHVGSRGRSHGVADDSNLLPNSEDDITFFLSVFVGVEAEYVP